MRARQAWHDHAGRCRECHSRSVATFAPRTASRAVRERLAGAHRRANGAPLQSPLRRNAARYSRWPSSRCSYATAPARRSLRHARIVKRGAKKKEKVSSTRFRPTRLASVRTPKAQRNLKRPVALLGVENQARRKSHFTNRRGRHRRRGAAVSRALRSYNSTKDMWLLGIRRRGRARARVGEAALCTVHAWLK